jgi:D-aminopeptidase
LIGTVSIHADYTVPVQPIRDELRDAVSRSASWDHKVCALQVVNASEHTVELRAVVSADNSAKLWDLRCEVREDLIGFLQASYPDCLPRVRVDLGRPAVTGEQGLSRLADQHGVR